MSDRVVLPPGVVAFYGVDHNAFKLGDRILEAVEDPSDGYRSYLETICTASSWIKPELFSRVPLAYVHVVKLDKQYGMKGYALVDIADGHIWLTVGTNYYDDWYPYFVFEYTPKPGPLPE